MIAVFDFLLETSGWYARLLGRSKDKVIPSLRVEILEHGGKYTKVKLPHEPVVLK